MTAAVDIALTKPRYNGFTCPNCGSHMFGTVLKWRQVFMGNKWPEGAAIGHCNEYTYRNVNCRYEWNRDDVHAESTAMYHPTEKDWQESLVATRALVETTVVVTPRHAQTLSGNRRGTAPRVYTGYDRRSGERWRVYPDDSLSSYLVDNFGDLVKIP